MTIEQQLRNILDVKTQLRTAIQQKGGSIAVATPFNEYAAKIQQLSTLDNSTGNIDFEVINGELYPKTMTIKAGTAALSLTDEYGACSISELIIENGIKSLPLSFMLNATRLKNVNLGSTLEVVPDSLFRLCTSLLAVTFPASVKTIGLDVVRGCTALVELKLLCMGSANMTVSGGIAQGCTALTSVELSSAFTVINGNAFSGCTNLAQINLENITYLGSGALAYCTSLTSLSMPKLKTIVNSALTGSVNLVDVDFGLVTAFDAGLLANATKIKKLVLKATDACTFAANAFTGLNSLKYIEIRASSFSMVANSFTGLTVCEAVKIDAITPPVVSGAPFAGFNASIFKIYVPDASVDTYKTKSGWTTLAAYIFPMSQFVMPVI